MENVNIKLSLSRVPILFSIALLVCISHRGKKKALNTPAVRDNTSYLAQGFNFPEQSWRSLWTLAVPSNMSAVKPFTRDSKPESITSKTFSTLTPVRVFVCIPVNVNSNGFFTR